MVEKMAVVMVVQSAVSTGVMLVDMMVDRLVE
jgi:hypothetical protein